MDVSSKMTGEGLNIAAVSKSDEGLVEILRKCVTTSVSLKLPFSEAMSQSEIKRGCQILT